MAILHFSMIVKKRIARGSHESHVTRENAPDASALSQEISRLKYSDKFKTVKLLSYYLRFIGDS